MGKNIPGTSLQKVTHFHVSYTYKTHVSVLSDAPVAAAARAKANGRVSICYIFFRCVNRHPASQSIRNDERASSHDALL